MKDKKKMIVVALILLAIGFAAVTTTLLLNGNTLFGTNTDDFDIYFSKAVIDGVENNAVISQDGKSITYETANLQVAGDTSQLDYTVTNNSSMYDAKVSIECDFSGNEYVILENSLEDELIEAKSEETGTSTATLIKTSTIDRTQNFVCTIVAEAVERETEASDVIIDGESSTYSLYGYLVDDNDNPLANHIVVAYSNPQYVTSATDGYLYTENLEKGSHTLYVLNNVTIEDIEKLSEEEIETQAITNADFTTGSLNIVFPNGYRIVDTVIEKTRTITVSFDPNGTDTEIEDKTYTIGKDLVYGGLPELTREGYTFQGWFNEEENKVSSTTRVSETTTELTAKWEPNTYTITFNANGGTVTSTVAQVTYDGTYGELPTPTKFGNWTFDGWYTSETDGTKIESTTRVDIPENHTLYARWICAVGDVCIVSGTGETIEDILQIGNEQFHVISNDGTNIKMMSMYNLYVGGSYDNTATTWTAYTNPTGLQDSTMLGYNAVDTTIRRGTTAFSTSSTSYTGSIVEGYVNSYSSYLKTTLGVENTATLISKEELDTIVGTTLNADTHLNAFGAPAFLYSTSYWLRTAYSTEYVWILTSVSYINFRQPDYLSHYGVRPIITISASLI